MGLFNLFKRKSRRYIHFFVEEPVEPTRELANDLCQQLNIDYKDITDSRFFMYPVNIWPNDLDEYTVAVIKNNNRYPNKGNVVKLITKGTLDLPDGKKFGWAIVQVFDNVAIQSTKVK